LFQVVVLSVREIVREPRSLRRGGPRDRAIRSREVPIDRPCKTRVIWVAMALYCSTPIDPVITRLIVVVEDKGTKETSKLGNGPERSLNPLGISAQSRLHFSLSPSVLHERPPPIHRCFTRVKIRIVRPTPSNRPKVPCGAQFTQLFASPDSWSFASPAQVRSLLLSPVFYTSEIKSYCVVWPAVSVPRLLPSPDSLVLRIARPI